MKRALSRLLLSVVFLGCSTAREPRSPREVLAAYGQAIIDGRLEDAYALLSTEARRELSYEAFARMVRENPGEHRELAATLSRPSAPPSLTATVTARDGTTLQLVWEDGTWKVEGAALDFYSQATPQAAVGALVRAYRNRRWDLLLRFVPDRERDGLTAKALEAAWTGPQKEEIEPLMRALEAALREPRVELLGDRATFQYGTSGVLELVLEDGRWKVEDFQ